MAGVIEDVILVVEERIHVKVVLDHADLAERFSLLGEQGEPLMLRVYQGEGGPATLVGGLTGSRSDVVSVSARARELVLMLGEEVVQRRGLGEFSGEDVLVLDEH